MKILAILLRRHCVNDLGKFNCMCCLFDTETNMTEFETIKTYRIE
jgi:hypothetical protein